MRDKPPAILKFAFKIPTLIYRAGMGRLLGRRFVLLVHEGRKSGLERRSVLEVIKYEADPPSAAVLSGWGDRSQWFRNLEAAPPLAVFIGGDRWAEASCEFLQPDEVVDVIEEYRHNHPLLMWTLDRFYGWPRGASSEERKGLARELRVVVFRPVESSEREQTVATDDAAPTESSATELPFVRSKGDPQKDGK